MPLQRAFVSLACVGAAVAVLGVLASTASASGISWSTPTDIDGATPLVGVSCASTSLCVAVDQPGHALITTNPAAATPTWSTSADLDGSAHPQGVSCASTSLCVEIDDAGKAWTTTNPTAGASANWVSKTIDGFVPLAISCPSNSLCLAVDADGYVVTTTNPTAGSTATWTAAQIDAGHFLQRVSCASTSLCVAVDNAGYEFVTTDPSDGASATWSSVHIDGSSSLLGVSCEPTSSLCVAVDQAGKSTITTNPTAGISTTWSTPTAIDTQTPNGLSCPTTSFCVVVDGAGNALTTTNPTAGASANWASTNIDGTNNLQWVSCEPTASLCVAVDAVGNAVIGQMAQSVAPTSPTDSTLPQVTGTTTVGASLTSSTGTWLGTMPISFATQWQRCDPGCSNIPGATGSSYTLAAADLGARVRVVVTASNIAGSAQASSSEVGTVAPSAAQIKASLLGQLRAHGKAAKIAALLKAHGYALLFAALTGGKLVIDWYYLPKGAHLASSKPKPVLIAAGKATFTQAATRKLTIKLSASGKRLLKHARRLAVTARGTFSPTGRPAVITTKEFTLTR